jgi:CubicO group peptidase (beta-lactamase class C family)
MAERKKTSVLTHILWFLLILFVAVNIAIQISGNTYVYKALAYNYANIDDLDIFPTRIIKNGNPEPWKIATDYNKAKMPDTVRAELEKLESVAYLVIKDDSIKYEEYWDRYGPKSLSNSFSMAKSVVGLLIGIAHDEGKIKSLDEPICNYLPEYCDEKSKQVTIRHLLMMSSGSTWDESYSSLFSATTKAYYGDDLEKLMFKEIKMKGEPGKIYHYKSGDTQLLTFIVERATGKTASDYLSEKIWSRIGAELPAQWSLDHEGGHEKGYCCIYSDARDFARLGKLMMDSGRWNGQQIISTDFVSHTLAANALFYHDEEKAKVTTYGYLWWLMKYKGHDIFYMRGLLGQYVFVIPDERMIIVRLGKQREKKQIERRPIEVDYIVQGALSMYGERK